jgi:hypothetical protein
LKTGYLPRPLSSGVFNTGSIEAAAPRSLPLRDGASSGVFNTGSIEAR